METSRIRRQREKGYTLVELLVVILILGILAGLAIPVFLSQRQKGYDTAAKSDLRNLAHYEEVYLDDFGAYATIAALRASESTFSVSKNITVAVVRYNWSIGYCLSAVNAESSNTWFYDSIGGGLQPAGSTGCSMTTTGTVGDSFTG